MKKIAATLAGVVVVATAVAGQANADSGWICDTLASSPNRAGVLAVIGELVSQGYTQDNGGPELFAMTVVTQCPEFIPVIQRMAAQLA